MPNVTDLPSALPLSQLALPLSLKRHRQPLRPNRTQIPPFHPDQLSPLLPRSRFARDQEPLARFETLGL